MAPSCPSCPICCETYNASTRSKVVCNLGDCEHECCKTCVRMYLLSTRNEPHCMNCKRGYTQNFIVTNLNRSFTDNDFKKHRRQLLLEHELSRMPETMQLAENYNNIDKYTERIRGYDERIRELNKELISLRQKKYEDQLTIGNLRSGKQDNEERKKFVFPCPADDCRGYLSTQYKCGYCSLYTCPKCHEIVGHSRDDPHTCDPNSVASAEEIKKTCKGCPSCGVPIQKISGCDQMYCTECRIAFSWNTGKIDSTGNIHNPHFYQQMRHENNGVQLRNPQDILCGGLINYYQFNGLLQKVKTIEAVYNKRYPDLEERVNIINKVFASLHRLINHITNNDLRILRQRVRDLEDNRLLRVEYINKKRSKDELAMAVFKNDIQRKKTIDILQINELLSVVGIENFTNLYNSKLNDIGFIKLVETFINDYKNLIAYTNDEMRLVSITYNQMVCIIDSSTFGWSNEKIPKSQLNSILVAKHMAKSNNTEASCSTDPL